RTAFLDQACDGDAELRALVEALIRADESAGAFLDRPAAELAPELLAGEPEPAPEPPMAGRQIGPWRVVREVGRGGMGAVYLAERADGAFEQTVALKLIKRGLARAEILQRFLRERRILARLEHRNIARLADGGVTDDGLPWFAMEYVEGQPITDWCDEHRAGVEERLRLFRAVCDAVQYAHRNLVVHRDLKPSNIFVTADGEVKLLDFGIARLLSDEPDGDALTLTREGLRVLTPHYAAPEQLRGEAATTATDLYSLGVVLYELLSGARPFGRSATSLDQLRREVLEEEPVPPSGLRSEWRHPLRGDLDNIVLTALRKEPQRRYPSVEALLADLERYREGRPVQATPPSARYRIAKFVRRNRVSVIAGAVVTLTFLVGVVATMWQAVAAALVVASLVGGLAVSIGQTRLARREARKAEEVRSFLLRVFEVADPYHSRGQSVTARELLDQGARRIDSELKGQPALRAEMLGVLADLYLKLALVEPAMKSFRAFIECAHYT
ncbi:MAG: serine/threonine-protein kinase, partial [Candidatus Eisenbacteria bacterium]